ncbi:MAG: hypothetical protein K9L78_03400 [Victivallales bacterium]|nr:hypothetical protein [Victivallales bacterium]
MTRELTYAKAINEALFQAMELDSSVICYGLGVPDPKGIFGTTTGLQNKFGCDRVFDMPLSENAMTGVAIGASLNGIRPVMKHQRLDFFLMAMDQLVNNAAKWHYMYGGNKSSVPITIRLIVGRGWGQGPTHSQCLHAWFAHIPGLKVVMPSTPMDAKGMLLSAIFDNNPVVFIEHRWLHNQLGYVPENDYRIPLDKAQVIRQGKDITIASLSYMSLEAIHAASFLEKKGISCEVVDLKSVNPIDTQTVNNSVKKTGRLLVLDIGNKSCSVASEVIARSCSLCFNSFKCAPQSIALPDIPTPTSRALTRKFYPRTEDIINIISTMFGKQFDISEIIAQRGEFWDVPGDWFKGPF